MILQQIVLDGNHLTIDELFEASRRQVRIDWLEHSRRAVEKSRALIDRCVSEGRTVYGVSTGFGLLSNVHISTDQLEQLQANLIRSHAAGVGKPLSPEETRAMLLIRANVLAKGFSGVRPVVVETLLAMLARDVLPVIPEKGSVGASGDLAPSAHLALVLMGEGKAVYQGQEMPGGEAMRQAGIPTLTFQAKEGLAVLNGTHCMSAVGSLLAHEADYLNRAASTIAAMTTDALRGTDSHFDARIHNVRPHPGQRAVAAEILSLMEGSGLRQAHLDCNRVQDAYSLRCIPQVHGAVRDTLTHVRAVLEREINSATDNPLVFADTETVLSGGNFHGEPVAFALDFLGIAAAELASISERRIERLVNPDLSGLPAFLTKEAGLNSGFMIAHLTAVSLVSENKVLAHPASVDSLPTSANKEDHVSMGMTAAVKLRQIVENVRTVLAVEALAAAQGLDFLQPLKSSPMVENARSVIRGRVSFMENDRNMSDDILAVVGLLQNHEIPAPERREENVR